MVNNYCTIPKKLSVGVFRWEFRHKKVMPYPKGPYEEGGKQVIKRSCPIPKDPMRKGV